MIMNIVKSLAVGLVAGVVALVARLQLDMFVYAWRTGALWRGNTAVGFDVVSATLRDVYGGLLSLGVMILVGAYCYRRLSTGRPVPLPLAAASLCFVMVAACVAFLLSIALTLSARPEEPQQVIILLPVMAAVLVGTCGFFAGLLAGAWLNQRLNRFRSLSGLLLTGAGAGALCGALTLELITVWAGSSRPLAPIEHFGFALLGGIPGIVWGTLATLAFRSRLLHRPPTPVP